MHKLRKKHGLDAHSLKFTQFLLLNPKLGRETHFEKLKFNDKVMSRI